MRSYISRHHAFGRFGHAIGWAAVIIGIICLILSLFVVNPIAFVKAFFILALGGLTLAIYSDHIVRSEEDRYFNGQQ